MKPSVYLETTISSYLTAWQSPDLIMAARQQVTRQWWDERRHDFDLFVSEIVILEVSAGDPDAAARRLAVLDGLPLLEPKEDTDELVTALVEGLALPKKAYADAAHIALCVVNGIDFLVTWNFTHIANAALRSTIDLICESFGYEPPVICTPEELMDHEHET